MNPDAKSLVRAILTRLRDLDSSASKTKLLKLLYLADIEHVRKTGSTLTGFDWIFYLHGPWAADFDKVLEQLQTEGLIDVRDSTDTSVEGQAIHITDALDLGKVISDTDEYFRTKRMIDTFSALSTPELLDYDYFSTEPMEGAARFRPTFIPMTKHKKRLAIAAAALVCLITTAQVAHKYAVLDIAQVWSAAQTFLSVNGELNASQFAGADILAQIESACNYGTGHNRVMVPTGSYTATSTMLFSSSACDIDLGGSTIAYAGTGDAIRYFDATFLKDGYSQGGSISNGTIIACNPAGCGRGEPSATSILHIGDLTNFHLRNLNLECYSAGGSTTGTVGLWIDNTVGWTEHLHGDNIYIGSCAQGHLYTRNGGTDSMGYGEWTNEHIYVKPGQEGFAVKGGIGIFRSNDIGLYANTFTRLGFNGGSGGSKTFIHVYCNGVIEDSNLNIFGEDDGTGATDGYVIQTDASCGAGSVQGQMINNTGSVGFWPVTGIMGVLNNGSISWLMGNAMGSDITLRPNVHTVVPTDGSANASSPAFNLVGRYGNGTSGFNDLVASFKLALPSGTAPAGALSIAVRSAPGQHHTALQTSADLSQWVNTWGGTVNLYPSSGGFTGTRNYIFGDSGNSSNTYIPVESSTPTPGAGVCWKTATTLGTCTAGTWPNCSTCN